MRTIHMPPVLSVREAAEVLGISTGHGYFLARCGELPGARRLGGRIVVLGSELERYLAGEPVRTAEQPTKPRSS